MPLKPLSQITSSLFPDLGKGRADSGHDSDIRATHKAAAWRAQISRAYLYQKARARTDAQREALDKAYEQAMEDRPDFTRIHGGSDYALPPVKHFDAREAREIIKQARAIERGTYENREKGQHGGVIGKSALRVLETMLFVLWPICRKGMFPSLEHIAAKAQLSVRTVQTCLAVLKLLGFLTVFRRMKRVASALGQMVQQDTNAYLLHLPKGLGAIGAALFGMHPPDGKNFQANENPFISYGFAPANEQQQSGDRPLKGPHNPFLGALRALAP